MIMAEMAGYRRVNYYELCRLCTSSEGTKMHIFREEGRRRSLPNKIQTCLPLTVQEEDSLPKIICGVCAEKLEGFFEFRESCINAEAMLESYFTSLRYSDDLSREGKVSVYVKEEPNKKKEDNVGKMKSQQLLQPIPVSACTTISSGAPSMSQSPPPHSSSNVNNQSSSDGIGLPSAIQILTDQDGNRLAQYKVQVQGGVPSLVPTYSSVQMPMPLHQMKTMHMSHDVTQTTQTEHCAPPPPPLVAAVTLTPQSQCQDIYTFSTKDNRYARAPLTHISDVLKMKNISIVDTSGMEPGLAQIRLDPEQLSQLMAGSGLHLSLGQMNKPKLEDSKEQITEHIDIENKIDEGEQVGEEEMSQTTADLQGDLQGDIQNEGSEDMMTFECDICDKTFKRKEHLLQHKKSHTGQRPFGCGYCGKAFSRKEHLIRHKVSHTGQKLYPCDVCQKNFSRKDNLHKHKKTHGINGPHVCEVCGKSFVVKHYYAIHRATHEKEKGQPAATNRCDICSKTFATRSALDTHRQRHRAKQKHTQPEQAPPPQHTEDEQHQQQQQQQQQQQHQQQQQQQQPTILTTFPINTGLATINPHALLAPNIVHSSSNMVHIGNNSYVCSTELLDQYRRLHS